MEDVFKSIDDWIDFEILLYKPTEDGGEFFYLMEQSSLQVLYLLPSGTSLKVVAIFSERHRIAKRTDEFFATSSVGEFLQIALPLVENGCFPCKNLELLLNGQLELFCYDDDAVHLKSKNKELIQQIVAKTLIRENYDESLLQMVIEAPDVYHKLARPDKIVASFQTYDELIDAL
jgi:hypothetical protein